MKNRSTKRKERVIAGRPFRLHSIPYKIYTYHIYNWPWSIGRIPSYSLTLVYVLLLQAMKEAGAVPLQALCSHSEPDVRMLADKTLKEMQRFSWKSEKGRPMKLGPIIYAWKQVKSDMYMYRCIYTIYLCICQWTFSPKPKRVDESQRKE